MSKGGSFRIQTTSNSSRNAVRPVPTSYQSPPASGSTVCAGIASAFGRPPGPSSSVPIVHTANSWPRLSASRRNAIVVSFSGSRRSIGSMTKRWRIGGWREGNVPRKLSRGYRRRPSAGGGSTRASPLTAIPGAGRKTRAPSRRAAEVVPPGSRTIPRRDPHRRVLDLRLRLADLPPGNPLRGASGRLPAGLEPAFLAVVDGPSRRSPGSPGPCGHPGAGSWTPRCWGIAYRLAEEGDAAVHPRRPGHTRTRRLCPHGDRDSNWTRLPSKPRPPHRHRRKVVAGLTYQAWPGNRNYAGPAPIDEIASQVIPLQQARAAPTPTTSAIWMPH